VSNRLQALECDRIRLQAPMPIIASVNGHAQAVVVIVSREPWHATVAVVDRPAYVRADPELDQCVLSQQRAA
jgi:hypothetical protein